jgi:hypothetical protein
LAAGHEDFGALGTVNVGVITTHKPVVSDAGAGWLPGAYRGGAELSDAEYFRAAPQGVVWEYTTPRDAAVFDRVLVTSVDGLSDADAEHLASLEPVVFLHHATQPTDAKRMIVDAARVLMLHTPAHAERTLAWSSPRRVELVLSCLDFDSPPPAVRRERFALAACRDHPLKGVANAKKWAAIHDMPLVVMTREERSTVLEAMSRAEVFVHLPLEFESEGRSVMEAVLSGCRVVTNANVGVTSVAGWDDPGVLAPMIRDAASEYWRIVCE